MVPKTCSIPECNRPFKGRGFCDTHLQQKRRAGEIKPRTAWERFSELIDTSTDCWIWAGAKNNANYGMFHFEGKTRLAHRASWEMSNGAIPDGLDIDHVCHVRLCVNPEHLRAVTRKQNLENAVGPDRNNKSSGIRGVTRVGKKWKAQVGHNGRNIHCGHYDDIRDAEKAAIAMRLALFTHNDEDRGLLVESRKRNSDV